MASEGNLTNPGRAGNDKENVKPSTPSCVPIKPADTAFNDGRLKGPVAHSLSLLRGVIGQTYTTPISSCVARL
ncbi:hypothetical protein AJ78_03772 [Emergomyces pasteurianus Ep9510]|uniref:Uncharacterized protein n=1 Tax=Emergomyces pasteurianus Ep9510 TaxID=1447872 RepID=A0A1J9Q702_9EURO|nr:hypothetical protein AJ78_03772 [Emergomyces pasteurianus Ep9510]